MNWSEASESFKQFPDFAKEYPCYAALVVVATVIVIIVICCVIIFLKFPDPALKWMEYEEKRNETSGKRRAPPKQSSWLKIGIVIIFFLIVLFFLLWTIFTRLGEEQSDSSATDGSGNYTEEMEETSSELIEEEEVRYVVVQADVTWKEAELACEEDGGHLATITSQEEYEQVVDILDSYILENGSSAEDIFYVWLGGCTGTLGNGRHSFYWITNEQWDTEIERFWCNITLDDGTQISEPSYTDADTGIEETRLVLWGQEMTILLDREEVKLRWTFSDQNEDLPNLSDGSKDAKGRIAYICEYDDDTVDLYD